MTKEILEEKEDIQPEIKEEKKLKKTAHPFDKISKEQLLEKVKKLESEILQLRNRLARASRRGTPRGMGIG